MPLIPKARLILPRSANPMLLQAIGRGDFRGFFPTLARLYALTITRSCGLPDPGAFIVTDPVRGAEQRLSPSGALSARSSRSHFPEPRLQLIFWVADRPF